MGVPSTLYYYIYLMTRWEILVNLLVQQAFQASAILRAAISKSERYVIAHVCAKGTDYNVRKSMSRCLGLCWSLAAVFCAMQSIWASQ